MKTLLIVNSSPRQNSVSRRLTRHFADAWKADNLDGRVIERDLVADPPPFVTHAWIEAAYTPADRLTPEQAKLLAVSDAFIRSCSTPTRSCSEFRCTTSPSRPRSRLGLTW